MNNIQRNFRDKNQGLRKLANGGDVDGPGTGTSDTAGKFALSDGEYVLPADTVKAVGKGSLDRLREATHEPVGSRAKPGAAAGFPGMADGGLVDPFPDATGLQARDIVPPRPIAQPFPSAGGLQARDILGPNGAAPVQPAAAATPSPAATPPGADVSSDFAKRTSALRQNVDAGGTVRPPPGAAAAAEAAPGATGPAAEAVSAAGNAAKTGLGGRLLGGAVRTLAVPYAAGQAIHGAVNAYNTPTDAYANAIGDDGRPGPISNAIASAVQGVSKIVGGSPLTDAQRDAAAEAYHGMGTRALGTLGDVGNSILKGVGTDTGFDDAVGRQPEPAAAGDTGANRPTLPAVPQLSVGGDAANAGGSGGSYTVNGKTVNLSPQDVAALGGRLPTTPSGVAPGQAGIGNGGSSTDDVTGQVLRQLLSSGGVNRNLVPQDRSTEINNHYDNLTDIAKKSFTSQAGQGNLVRHLVDIEQARNQALGTDASRLTGLAESDANNRQSGLRSVAEISNQQAGLRQRAFENARQMAQLDRQYSLDRQKYGEASASSVNDYTDRQFTGADGKPDAAQSSAFRQFLNENPQKYGGGRDLSDLPAKERYAALDQAVTDFKLGQARNDSVGSHLGGLTTQGQVTYGKPRDAEFGDITKGAGILPTLYSKLRGIGGVGNAANYQVTQDSLGNVVPVRNLAYDENGNLSNDRLKRLNGGQ